MIESEIELTFRLSVNEFEQIPFTRGLSEPAHLLIIDKFGNDVKCVEKSSFDPFVMMLAFGVHEFYFVAAENKWSSFDTEHLQLTWHDDSTGLGRVWACRMSIDVGKTSLEENIILPLVVADVKVEVLGPIGGKENQYQDDLNNRSVFVKITYGDVSLLITGDGEYQEEMDVIDWLNSDDGKTSGISAQSTIYVAGHHGSHTSSSRRFLAMVKPKYGIISCAKDNEFGHPHESTLTNFKDVNARVYRTDELGTIVIGTDGKTLVN